MSLLWFDGFEMYDNYIDLDKVYASLGGTTGSIANGRRGSKAWVPFNAINTELPGNPQTIVFGAAVYAEGIEALSATDNDGATRSLFKVQDVVSGNTHLYFQVNSDRLIVVKDSAWGVIGTTSGHTIEGNTWYYIEVKVTISNTVGQVTINVDGVERLSTAADKDTCNGSNEYVGCVMFCRIYPINTRFDDYYICDTSGSKNNDFLGDIRVDILRPTANGANSDFTPKSGSNYENVDETQGPDDDSTYNESNTLNHKDSYEMGDLTPLGSTIYGAKSQITVRKTDAGAANMGHLVRTGGTDFVSGEYTLSDSFITYTRMMEDDPSGEIEWTEDAINSGEVGLEIVSI